MRAAWSLRRPGCGLARGARQQQAGSPENEERRRGPLDGDLDHAGDAMLHDSAWVAGGGGNELDLDGAVADLGGDATDGCVDAAVLRPGKAIEAHRRPLSRAHAPYRRARIEI